MKKQQGSAMIKSELITKMAEQQTFLPPKDIELAVNLILDQLTHSLAGNDRIEIRGFGSFSLHYRPTRQAHNPKTGARVHTQPKYSVHFKPGKGLRESIDASKAHCEISRDNAIVDEESY
jgi:integration host factor subunit beta